MLVGHHEVVEALGSRLPQISVITGPPSVGKRLIAAYAGIKNNVSRSDFTEVMRLTADEAARVKQFVSVAPLQSFRYVIVDLDNASSQAMDKLLFTLENPPEYARFSLISSRRIPRTLETRSNRFTVGLLQPQDLLAILLEKGIPHAEAVKLSHLGRVNVALHTYENSAAKHTALSVFNAVESQDHILLLQAFKSVDDTAAELMLTALEESAAQNWKVFDPKHLGAFAKRNVALKLLAVWSTMAGARPQLAMRVVMESVMRG